MRKEIVFAIISGGILGLIIAFGIVRINSTLKINQNQTNKTSDTTAEVTTPKSVSGLTLAKPDPNTVAYEGTYEFAGVTGQNSLVAISSEEKDYLVLANTDGSFSQSVSLIPGLNEVILTSFDQSRNPTEEKLNIVFSSEFGKLVKTVQSPTQSPTTTQASVSAEPKNDNSDAIRKKVEEKVDSILKNPKAYIGTITDITDTTFQIKNSSGEIQQVATNQDVSYVKSITQVKEIKRADIAIGDFIIAMGYTNGSKVLETKRVLVIMADSTDAKKIYLGNISKLTKKNFTLTIPNSDDTFTATPIKNASVLTYTDGKIVKLTYVDLSPNDEVVVFGKNNDDTFEARTIIKIVEKESSASQSGEELPTPKVSPKPTLKITPKVTPSS